MDFSNKKIVFVTGKGGVGKSAVAAGIAFREAKKGRKVLLVELGDRSFYAPFFGLREVTQNPYPINYSVDVARWSRDECLREYVVHYLKVERVYKIFFQNKIMRAFLDAAPAVSELALLGKLTSGIMKVGPPLDYELIVVDGFATGHALALIRAPKGISEAVPIGPLGDNSRVIYGIMTNPEYCSYVVVALPETLPTVEATELFTTIKSEFGIEPYVVCNRILDPPLSADRIGALAAEMESIARRDGFVGFVRYLNFALQRQKKMLSSLFELRKEVWGVPIIADAENSVDMVEKIEGCFGKPWIVS